MKVIQTPLPINQYYPEPQKKLQIVLHHTVSNPLSPQGDIGFWRSDSTRIATYCIISYDGTINRCFPSNAWAHHLGVKTSELKSIGFKDFMIRNNILNRNSIAIELDGWGGVTKYHDNFFNVYGKPLDKSLDVIECKWRGYEYFQKYSDEQIQALEELISYLMKTYSIPSYGIKDGNIDLRKDALNSVPGIYSHSSYRLDKSDLYPDERIFRMLKNL